MVIVPNGVQLSVIMQVINTIGQPQNMSPICHLWVWLQTQLNETKSCYQLIITISEKNKSFTVISIHLPVRQITHIGQFLQ